MIAPEVTKFNTYINQKKSKTFLSDLKINAEYIIKNALVNMLGKEAKERFASAYTVLCKKADTQLEIF